MKKLLSVLGTITLVGTVSTNVIACGGGEKPPAPYTKTDISTEITTLTTNIKANIYLINYFLKEEIEKCKEFNDLQPKLKDCQIKYYSDAQINNEVTYHNQQAGDLYIVITAKFDDANYQGSTNPIKITLKQKTDISIEITTLTTDISANVNKNNNELDTQIKSTNELKSLNPNLTNPTIKYYSDAQINNEVTYHNQQVGDLYIVITAKFDDANYQGSTNPIKITLKQKTDLKNITELTGLNLKVDLSHLYHYLDQDIVKANEFKNKKIYNFRIKYYSDAQINNEVTYHNQQAGDLYIVITAKFDDDNYQGSTNPIKITLNY